MLRLAPLALALLSGTASAATIQLDFSTATIAWSNLGGEGPDGGEQRILYEGVGTVDGAGLDLEVREVAVEGNDYMAHNTASTMINGEFGQINMKADREATFEFCFLYSDSGEQAVLEEFGYVYHDFDNGNSDRERLRAAGQSEFLTSEDLADADGPVPTQLDIETLDDGRVQFTSTEKGTGKDNAADPDDLSALQKSRMVQLRYTDTACITLSFTILVGDADEPAFASQNCTPPSLGALADPSRRSGSLICFSHVRAPRTPGHRRPQLPLRSRRSSGASLGVRAAEPTARAAVAVAATAHAAAARGATGLAAAAAAICQAGRVAVRRRPGHGKNGEPSSARANTPPPISSVLLYLQHRTLTRAHRRTQHCASVPEGYDINDADDPAVQRMLQRAFAINDKHQNTV